MEEPDRPANPLRPTPKSNTRRQPKSLPDPTRETPSRGSGLRQSALTAESLPPLARPLQIRDFAIDTLEPGHP